MAKTPRPQQQQPRQQVQPGTPQQQTAATPAVASAPQPHPAPMIARDAGVSPVMQGSLPPGASGADVYSRQFYGGNNLPKRRFLPVTLVP